MYNISEIARRLETTAHTLRYYEKEKLLSPNRNANGERVYSEGELKWLQFVMKLKQTQMPIAKIRKYAELLKEGEHTAAARLQLLNEHRESIKEQIENLLETEKLLNKKINAYKQMIRK
ncbi:MerR family transcriptional regulator [Heyndrickxia acidicola]|uniref:MerR family transcriptional regulator n=1 Tax=Heyndrickxia acidicola TaxID=209389 RepID=A0ABU6MM13_9BACI|nr:MerR family transcriptional regulator [Heyndrickxia acidicola]MED1205721.1 MerR family transcriptional regulator [Heyndrickxia acidicola]